MAPLAVGSASGRVASGSCTKSPSAFHKSPTIDRFRPALAWADAILGDYSKTPTESRAYQAGFGVAFPRSVRRAMTHGDLMGDEQEDLAYLLGKAEDHRKKAIAVSEPGLKAALEAVAREYMLKARELDSTLAGNGRN
jgi:hypothetical protein